MTRARNAEILRRWLEGGNTQTSIAANFGLTRQRVSQIIRNEERRLARDRWAAAYRDSVTRAETSEEVRALVAHADVLDAIAGGVWVVAEQTFTCPLCRSEVREVERDGHMDWHLNLRLVLEQLQRRHIRALE